MNQELENYIQQSKQAGKSEEVIKQELQNAGWGKADISQALGIQTSPITGSNTLIISWFSSKTLAVIIGALLVVGGGAYFMFSDNTSDNISDNNSGPTNNSINPTKTPKTTSQNSSSFNCKDLLSDDEFETAVGKQITDYRLIEQGEDLTKGEGIAAEGLKKIGFGPEQYKEGSTQYVCSYVSNTTPQYEVDIAGYTAGEFIIQILRNKEDMTEGYNNLRNSVFNSPTEGSYDLTAEGQTQNVSYRTNAKEETEVVVNGEVIAVLPPQQISAKDVSGIGSAAFEENNNLTMLSSNKKYLVSFLGQGSINIKKEIAKVVDANLSKY